MNLLAVAGTNFFLKRARKTSRLFLVTLIHSGAGLLCLLCIHNFMLYRLMSHFVLNTGMIFFCFGKNDWKTFLENWAVTYLVVIFSGGIMQWFFESGIGTQPFFFQVLLLAFAGYGILFYFMHRKTFANHIYPVQIRKEERCVEVKGYWDSGNQLLDPYNGQAICILSSKKAKEFFDERQDKIRYVPYRSLGQEGLLCVTNVDELILFDGKKTIHRKETAIGIANDGLLEGKEYDLILHSSIL